MFTVTQRMGATAKEMGRFETENEAQGFIMKEWEEAREEAVMFHNDLDEDSVMELFMDDYMINDDGRELITMEQLIEIYDDMLDECYPEMFNMSPSTILYRADKIAYDCGLHDFYDSICDEYYCEDME